MSKNHWHRCLAFLLSICMLLSMAPVSAFAVESQWTENAATVKVGETVSLTVSGTVTEEDVALSENPGVTVSCAEPSTVKALSEPVTEASGFDGTKNYILVSERDATEGMLTTETRNDTIEWVSPNRVVNGLLTKATVTADTEHLWQIQANGDDTYAVKHGEQYLAVSIGENASNASLTDETTALQMVYGQVTHGVDNGGSYWFIKSQDGSAWLSQVGGFDNGKLAAAGYPEEDCSGWTIREVVDQATTVVTFTATAIGTTTATIGDTVYTIQVTDGTVASGTCGAVGNEENVTWKLNDQGVLTISGTGAMADYKRGGSNPTPWTSAPWGEQYYNQVKSVVIEEGVTNVGNYAFSFLLWAESVTLPSTIETIGNYAFNRMYELTEVVIPDKVTTIGNYAFNECRELTTVTLPKNLKTIGTKAFYQCAKLTAVAIPEGTTEINSGAFYQCAALTSVTLPSTLESIGDQAFSSCNVLEGIDIPASVTSIGEQAFYSCDKLTSLTLHEGLQTIGEKAFEDCEALTSLVIPSSVTSIGQRAFYAIDDLAEIEIKEGLTTISSEAFSSLYDLKTLRLPKSLTSIETKAFYLNNVSKSKLTDVYYGGTEEEYGQITIATGNDVVKYTKGQTKPAFHFTEKGVEILASGTCGAEGNEENVTWKLDDQGVLTISGTGAMADYSSTTSVPWNSLKSKITSVVVEEGVTHIGQNAFNTCLKLTTLTLAASVTSFGARAFYNCSQITSAEIPGTLTNVGKEAFYSCRKMVTAVTISGQMGTKAFADCAALTSVTFGEQTTAIPENAFSGCKGLTSLEIPGTVKQIDGYAFLNCTSVKTLSLGEGVESIGKYAFQSLTAMTTLTLPVSVTNIGERAFYINSNETSSLADVYYGGTVEEYGQITIAKNNDVIRYTEGQTKPVFHFVEPATPTRESTVAVGAQTSEIFSGIYAAENVTVSTENVVELTFAATAMTEITSAEQFAGKQLILVSERSETDGLLTGDAYTATISWSGLEINGLNTHETVSADTQHLWTVTAADDDYYVRYGEKYLTLSYDAAAKTSTATLADEATALNLAYTDGKWYITNADGAYLSNVGGFGNGYYGASGFEEQGGSGWTIFAVEPLTTITATGTQEGETMVTVGEELWKITVSGHTHTYGTPAFNWTEDNTASAVFTCSSCDEAAEGHTMTLTATVGELVVTPGTCTAREKITYTATVTYGGQDYTDSKVITGEYGTHHFDENGFCTASASHYQPAETDENGVYLIDNAGKLYWFAEKVNGGEISINAKLTRDITVNPGTFAEDGTYTKAGEETLRSWIPMGSSATGKEYIGTFDGNEKIISGLYVNKSGSSSAYNYVGLFGCMTRGGCVKNVTISGSWFHGYAYVGAVVGSAAYATVENCHNAGTYVSSGSYSCGGVVGDTLAAVTDCTNSGKVSSISNGIGGVIGETEAAVVNCSNTGSVYSKSKWVGGVVGCIGYKGSVTGCTNSGDVTALGSSEIGGIAGCAKGPVSKCTNSGFVNSNGSEIGGIAGSALANITDCVNTGKIGKTETYNYPSYLGGIVGCVDDEDGVVISHCYNTGMISGSGYMGGIVGSIKGASSTVVNCYNTGDVVGGSSSGKTANALAGIAGRVYQATLENCYNIGSVIPDADDQNAGWFGGIIGYNNQGTAVNCFYLTGCATDGKGITQFGIGAKKAGEVTKDVEGSTTGKTAEEFASGEIAYLLNGSKSEGELVWKQNLDNGETPDASPKFVGGIVYQNENTYSNQQPQPAVDTVIRLEGQHRHETSLKTADEMKKVLGVEKFDTIIVADGYEFYDALSGSYLAAVKKAPILLSYSGDDKYAYLNDNNLDYIKANLAENGTVYILGGKNAVPTTYDTELKNSEINVKRLDGAHRFDTNLQILEEAGIPAGSEILVCTSSSFADSLSAAATGKPILLVWNERGSLYGNQTTFLSGLENCTFTIIGGEGAVREEFEEVLGGYGKVVRLAGDNRLQTSVKVAERYFQNVDQAVLAYAWEFPDGLCGGSLAYAMKAPLILTMTGMESAAVDYAAENGITSGIVLGGAARISDASVREIFAMAEDAEITVK